MVIVPPSIGPRSLKGRSGSWARPSVIRSVARMDRLLPGLDYPSVIYLKSPKAWCWAEGWTKGREASKATEPLPVFRACLWGKSESLIDNMP